MAAHRLGDARHRRRDALHARRAVRGRVMRHSGRLALPLAIAVLPVGRDRRPLELAWYRRLAPSRLARRAARAHPAPQYRRPWSQWRQRKKTCPQLGSAQMTNRSDSQWRSGAWNGAGRNSTEATNMGAPGRRPALDSAQGTDSSSCPSGPRVQAFTHEPRRPGRSRTSRLNVQNHAVPGERRHPGPAARQAGGFEAPGPNSAPHSASRSGAFGHGPSAASVVALRRDRLCGAAGARSAHPGSGVPATGAMASGPGSRQPLRERRQARALMEDHPFEAQRSMSRVPYRA